MANVLHNRRAKYEPVPEPSAPGWPTLYKTVREADVSKVDDCRDDIDTLLVFAGLYSAVLTAFVIESYTHLQQDSDDVIIGLLQQLVVQNFTSGPGFMNSTAAFPSPPQFQPPLWAIRVNVLWFTSLVLSLTCASFGILVKQWLREYLALEYTAPRERLRARQYRNPSLSKWKVFEIAAFLPLLLQLALGLFFLGLCFFTAAVHDSIGRTTAPLVCAWAFFIVITTIAPLFSPRCPFKTTFLKGALKIARRGFRAVRKRLSQSWDSFTFPILWHFVPSRSPAFEVSLEEEEDEVKREADDIDIVTLDSVDSLVSDDALLPIMLDTIRQQAGTSPAKLVEFVMQAIRRRCRSTFVHDLRPLSKYVWSVMTDAIVGAFSHDGAGPLALSATNRDWVYNSISTLVSPSLYKLSDYTAQTLREILVVPQRAPDHPCSGGVPLHQCLARIQVLPSDIACQYSGDSAPITCLRCVADVYKTLLCPNPEHSHPSLRHLLDTHMSNPDFVGSSKILLQTLFDVLVSVLLDSISSQSSGIEIPGSYEACHIVLQYGEQIGKGDDVIKLCRRMLLTDSTTHYILIAFAALHSQCRITPPTSEKSLVERALLLANASERTQMSISITDALALFINGSADEDNIPLDFLRMFPLCMAIPWSPNQTRGLLAEAIKRYYETGGWRKALRFPGYWCRDAQSTQPTDPFKEDQQLACEYLERCDEYGSLPSNLIDALWLFVPPERTAEMRQLLLEKGGYAPFPAPAIERQEERGSLGEVGGEGDASGGTEVQEYQGMDPSTSAEEDIHTEDSRTSGSHEEGVGDECSEVVGHSESEKSFEGDITGP